MHTHPGQAKHSAGYNDEFDSSSGDKPSQKIRAGRHLHRAKSVELETGVLRRLSEEQQGHRGLNIGLSRPEYSASYPSILAGAIKSNEFIPSGSINSDSVYNVSSRETNPYEECDWRKFTVASQIRATVFASWVNILLVCVPAGFVVNYTRGKSTETFVVNFFAIIPLSAIGEVAMREISMRNRVLADFLYISLSNFVQLVSSIILLRANQVSVLQTTLIGGILSNILLILGVSIFLGGLNRVGQNYNLFVAHTSANLLSLASTGLLIPTAAHLLSQISADNLTKQSRGASVVLLLVYFAYLLFQYKSHRQECEESSQKTEKRRRDAILGIAQIGKMNATSVGGNIAHAVQEKWNDPDDEPEQPQLLSWISLGLLVISTTLTAFCTQFAVDSIDSLSQKANLSKTFIGLILLPILNNDASPIKHALDDRMDTTVIFTIGKCLQTALFVLPFTVLLAWPLGVDMTLNFDGFEIVSLFASILLLNYMIFEGKSTWIQGILLLADWTLIAIAAFFTTEKI